MRPTIWSRPSSSKRPSSEVRNQPSTTEARRELGVGLVVAEERGAGDPDAPAVAEGDADAVERHAVVDAAAGRLRGAVGGDEVDARLLGAAARARRRARRRRRARCGSARARPAARGWPGCGAAGSARARRRPAWCCGRTRRHVRRPGRRRRSARGRRPGSGRSPARRRRTTTAARAASGRTPPAVGPTPRRSRARRDAGSTTPLGLPGGAGGLDQQRVGVVGLEPARQLPDRDRGLVRGPEEAHTANASGSATMGAMGRHGPRHRLEA